VVDSLKGRVVTSHSTAYAAGESNQQISISEDEEYSAIPATPPTPRSSKIADVPWLSSPSGYQKPGDRARAPGCSCHKCNNHRTAKQIYTLVTYASYDSIDLNGVTELSRHQYLICPSHVWAFILKDRIYGKSSMHK
jgi:hypothetical protein